MRGSWKPHTTAPWTWGEVSLTSSLTSGLVNVEGVQSRSVGSPGLPRGLVQDGG